VAIDLDVTLHDNVIRNEGDSLARESSIGKGVNDLIALRQQAQYVALWAKVLSGA
jgi:hypothetical protein